MKYTYSKNNEKKPIQPLLIEIFKSNIHKVGLGQPHFDDEAKVRKKKQVKDHKPNISVSVSRPHLGVPTKIKLHSIQSKMGLWG